MRPLLTVACTHFRLGVAQSGVIWMAAALFLVTLASAWLNWQRTAIEAAARESTQRQARQQWEQQGTKDPHSAAHFGMYAVKPVSVWQWFDPGIDPYLGTVIFMEAHKQDTPTASRIERLEWQRLLTVPTPAAILQLLLPLLTILCGFSVFAGDRETGILRQTMSTGLRPGILGVGKLLGATALLILLTGPTLLGIVLAAGFAGSPLGAGLLLIAGYAAYALTFLLISVAVSARSATAQSALTLLLSIWLGWCVLLPRMAADGAARLVPLPTFAAFWQQVNEDQAKGVDGHDDQNQRTEALKQQVLRQFGVDRVEDLPILFRGLALQAGEEYGNQVFDRRYGELWDKYRQQESVQFALALASPLLALRSASLAIAGTGMDEYRRFGVASETFRRQMVRKLNNEVTAAGPEGRSERDSRFWAQLPPFHFTAAPSAIGGNAWLLVAWLVISASVASYTVRGMRP